MKKTPRDSGVKWVQKNNCSRRCHTRISSPLQAPPTRYRKVRRDRPYEKMYWALPPHERHRVNKKMIWAVERLSDADGRAPPGTKSFLEEWARQLNIDLEQVGFEKASRRFRQAVSDRRRRTDSFYSRDLPQDLPEPTTRTIARIPTSSNFQHIKAPKPPESPYQPEGDEDLLAIPSFLDRKAEVAPNDPIRLCKRTKPKAA